MFTSEKLHRILAAVSVALLIAVTGLPAQEEDEDEDQAEAAQPEAPPPVATGGFPPPPVIGKRVTQSMNSIGSTRIEAHAKFLASDLMEGRGTGEKGGDLAAEYIATQFEILGLGKPVPSQAGATSYFQMVPLVGVETDLATSVVAFANDEETFTPTFLDQGIFWTETQTESVEVAAEMVFVGYGVYAPEVGWDDYKDVDVTGKILVMLVNDPPSDDPSHFGGKALTYYGRWTYKYWIAAAKGAAGAILVHNPEMAGYGWNVVRSSWGDEQSFIPLDPEGTPPLKIAGWMQEDAIRKVFTMAGQDYDAQKAAAAAKEFNPVPIKLDVAARVNSKLRQFQTRNVIGFIPGTDPAKQVEFVVFTAHYDHLGIGPEKDGDNIYNGLQDNATGVSALIEIARAFTRRSARTKRSLLFIATAAEEQGLLGSAHFTDRRNLFIFPARMAADINLDSISPMGMPADFVVLGADRSPQLKEYLHHASQTLNFAVTPDPHPEKGSFYRSDHFNFAKLGVPSASIKNGVQYPDKGEGWGEQQYQDYLANKYHQPADEYVEGMDFSGVAKAAQIAFYLGYRCGMDDALPMWNDGDEFDEERKESITELAEATAGQ